MWFKVKLVKFIKALPPLLPSSPWQWAEALTAAALLMAVMAVMRSGLEVWGERCLGAGAIENCLWQLSWYQAQTVQAFANSQSGMAGFAPLKATFYPLSPGVIFQWLWLPVAALLGQQIAYGAVVVLLLWFNGLAAVACLRRFSADRWAVGVGALVFALNPYGLQQLADGHPAELSAFLWPLLVVTFCSSLPAWLRKGLLFCEGLLLSVSLQWSGAFTLLAAALVTITVAKLRRMGRAKAAVWSGPAAALIWIIALEGMALSPLPWTRLSVAPFYYWLPQVGKPMSKTQDTPGSSEWRPQQWGQVGSGLVEFPWQGAQYTRFSQLLHGRKIFREFSLGKVAADSRPLLWPLMPGFSGPMSVLAETWQGEDNAFANYLEALQRDGARLSVASPEGAELAKALADFRQHGYTYLLLHERACNVISAQGGEVLFFKYYQQLNDVLGAPLCESDEPYGLGLPGGSWGETRQQAWYRLCVYELTPKAHKETSER